MFTYFNAIVYMVLITSSYLQFATFCRSPASR